MKRLLQKLLGNFTTLVLSVILSVIIWANAVRAANPIVLESFTLPVRIIEQPNLVYDASQVVSEVQVTVSGPNSVVESLKKNNNLVGMIDLTNATPEQRDFPIEINNVSQWSRLSLVAQFPKTAPILVDRRISKELPIVIDVTGTIARTHELKEKVSDPMAITLTGAASKINSIAEARVTIILDNARDTRTYTRPVIFYDSQGNVVSVDSVHLAQVTLSFSELEGIRDVPIRIDWVGQPSENYRFLGAKIEPRSILISGAPELIDTLRSVKTTSVDISGLKESRTFRVDLELPVGVTREDNEAIVVDVDIAPLETTSIFQLPVELVGMAEDLELTKELDPLRVILFGPIEALNTLSSQQQVRATVDLFGLTEGEHVLTPTISIPIQGVEVREYQPDLLTIDLQKKDTPTVEMLTPTP